MERHIPEVVGVRRTGWAALDRDPLVVQASTRAHSGANGLCRSRAISFCEAGTDSQ